MELTLSHCFIGVLDQEEALRFYRDVLGLEVRTDATMEHLRWLTVGPASQPEVEISLMPAAGPFVAPAERDGRGTGGQRGDVAVTRLSVMVVITAGRNAAAHLRLSCRLP
jgi:catechol 2,3-dioxygenase-like lactoylglutathione lyase family enzyme